MSKCRENVQGVKDLQIATVEFAKLTNAGSEAQEIDEVFLETDGNGIVWE